MDRFSELETFVAVAEAGGFNAAARRLGRSPPSVTRIISGLEERIGTRLFTRTTRQIAVTEAGARLLTDARRILDDLASAEASAAGAHGTPQGVLSVTAPVIFGRRYVAPVLRDYLARHPAVTARVLFVDRTVNLIEEGMDVAVRIGALPDSTLTAARVGAVRSVIVAAPAYVERHGAPERLEDLVAHRIVAPSMGLQPARWQFGDGVALDVAPAMLTNTIETAIDAALAGWAITRTLIYQVADALRDGRLVELLPGTDARVMPVHLVHAEGRLRAAKIRSFVDHAAAALRAEAANWDP